MKGIGWMLGHVNMSEDKDGEMEKDTFLFTPSLNKGGKKNPSGLVCPD